MGHEFFYLLALNRIFFQSPLVARALLGEAKSAESVFHSRENFARFFENKPILFDNFKNFNNWKRVERDLKLIEERKIKVVPFLDAKYPRLLGQIYDPPMLLFVRGNRLELLDSISVSIVGSRKATNRGLEVAFEIAGGLADLGVTVVSGLAFGVDAAAHSGALESSGGTVAVMGCGVDIDYPYSNKKIANKIEETGLIISEFPIGEQAQPYYFPQRNRIISGLSVATVVVEAAEKSGSLITARFALEQGREVAACPGNANILTYRGNNSLIKNGAALVENSTDVIEVIQKYLPKKASVKNPGHLCCDIAKHSHLLKIIEEHGEVSLDELASFSGFDSSELLVQLTGLVLEGKILELDCGRYKIR